MKKISLIHPSRGRPEQAFKTFWNWMQKARNWNNFDYIISLDYSDATLHEYTKWIDGSPIPILQINDNNSAIEAINKAAAISTGEILLVMSDDFDCNYYWDSLLIEALNDKSDFLAKTIDGIQKTLITLPIMDRKYYERFGYVYEPGYYHMFSDQEMTAVGHMLGKVIDLPLVFPHNHYSVGGMKKDAINAKNDATWIQGQNYFDKRLKNNFGLSPEQIVKPYSAIQWR